MVSACMFLMGFLFVCEHMCLCVYWAFTFALFLLLICLILDSLHQFYLILCYYYVLDACLYSNERRKEMAGILLNGK